MHRFSQSSLGGAGAVALALAATIVPAIAGPCDIYSSGGTPCVAAHSSTRALYSAFSGPLYQLIRASDSSTTNISPLSAGGVANAAAHDKFCAGTTCLFSTIYDQSGNGNHLTQAPPGGAAHGPLPNGDYLTAPAGAPVTLNGQKAYGVFIFPGSGYRNNNAKGTATGDQAEGIYAVLDGTHWNSNCCFDYGNAERDSNDDGAGTMEAIYFGNEGGYGSGAGSGPWLMADMENGVFSSGTSLNNPNDPTITNRFFTGFLKGQSNNWALRGGNSQSGGLSTYYSGVRPNGYQTMKKQGAIILGTGGDNSDGAQGTFYEGVMTSGYPSNATENAVQANVVAAKYNTASLNSGPGLSVGSHISLRATTACCTTRYIAHSGSTVNTQVVSSGSSTALKQQASFIVRAGLGFSGCYSFESVDTPGSFLRHSNFQIVLNANDGSKLFHEDATYCTAAGLDGQGDGLRSWSYPTRFFRHYNAIVYLASNGGPESFDATASFNEDTSFVISAGFA